MTPKQKRGDTTWGGQHIWETVFYLNGLSLTFRYEENLCNAVPDMPYQVDKHLMRASWSVVSNATDRSSRASAVTLPLLMLRLMSLCTFKRAVSVEWNFLYADCDISDVTRVDVRPEKVSYNLFKYFWNKGQVGNGSVALGRDVCLRTGFTCAQWCIYDVCYLSKLSV